MMSLVGSQNLVDIISLMNELRKERFLAILDVFYEEPLNGVHELRTMKNVIVTPHSAGTNGYWRRKQADIVIRDIQAFFANEPLINQVTRGQYQRMTIH
jgi:phosphoglycerate dehydrogenase-like enzyme